MKKIQPKAKEISILTQLSYSWYFLYLFLNHTLLGLDCEFDWILKQICSLLCRVQWWYHVWGLLETPRKVSIYQGMVIVYCWMRIEITEQYPLYLHIRRMGLVCLAWSSFHRNESWMRWDIPCLVRKVRKATAFWKAEHCLRFGTVQRWFIGMI